MDSPSHQLVEKLESLRRRLDDVQGLNAERGRLASAISIERAMMRLQMLADRLTLLPEPPPGVEPAALAEIDRALAYQVDQAYRIVFLLSDAAGRQERLSGLVDELLVTLEQMNELVSRRRDLVAST
jgi:hypothetical protein